jgi:uncharacterized protein (TIGR02145 family)
MKTSRNDFFKLVIFTATFIILFLPFLLNAQSGGTFKDPRDNYEYQTVKIGKKTWMAENLKYTTETGSWVYGNDSLNLACFGRLYDWSTAINSCPKGWGLPNDLDWKAMMKELGGVDVAGKKMQEMDSTNKNIIKKTTGDGKTLSTLLGGIRHSDGTFTGIGLWGGFWSGSSTNAGATDYLFAHGDKSIGISTNDKTSGFSVRCVKK